MSSPTHYFDNFLCKMSSPGKNLIIYDVLTTNIHGILAKNFKEISQNLKKLKVYLTLTYLPTVNDASVPRLTAGI